mmetsp:Transcript_4816/g.5219  ORF Transcript_4816/g.5219 Transcript_4816/m.5219 type:complete len:104 (+) Transcript_4816:55-366(+)
MSEQPQWKETRAEACIAHVEAEKEKHKRVKLEPKTVVTISPMEPIDDKYGTLQWQLVSLFKKAIETIQPSVMLHGDIRLRFQPILEVTVTNENKDAQQRFFFL